MRKRCSLGSFELRNQKKLLFFVAIKLSRGKIKLSLCYKDQSTETRGQSIIRQGMCLCLIWRPWSISCLYWTPFRCPFIRSWNRTGGWGNQSNLRLVSAVRGLLSEPGPRKHIVATRGFLSYLLGRSTSSQPGRKRHIQTSALLPHYFFHPTLCHLVGHMPKLSLCITHVPAPSLQTCCSVTT